MPFVLATARRRVSLLPPATSPLPHGHAYLEQPRSDRAIANAVPVDESEPKLPADARASTFAEYSVRGRWQLVSVKPQVEDRSADVAVRLLHAPAEPDCCFIKPFRMWRL